MYVCYLGHSTATKNKLEEEFYQHIKKIDRTVVQDEFIRDFQKKLLDYYDDLCKKHSRCKPIVKSFSKGWNNKGDVILYGSNCVFTILKTK